MRAIVQIAVITALLAAAVAPRSAFAQSDDLERKLSAAKNLVCTFTVQATGTWQGAKPSAAVTPATLDIAFFKIDVDEGSAEDDSGFGKSLIAVRFSQGYLHLIHMSDAGPLYLTTVFPKALPDGRLLAAHTRMEYSAAVVPGFTSRPELYVGSCQLNKPGVE